MKYSQQIGMLAVLLMAVACFLPWSIIESKQLTITGMQTVGTSFGRPGLFLLIFGTIGFILFALPMIWAKRTNVFVSALILAWSIRNYILVSTCMFGECPVKQPALYVLVVCAVVIQLMSFFPRIPVGTKQ
ncbi:MAG: hypothetical protein GXC72_11330 [Chitinophagaceae bacterium]|nr:hypothetical protein [Chitinophagaceae bacterium]